MEQKAVTPILGSPRVHDEWPFHDLVPDEATAKAIGMALLTAYFGEAVIEKWHPYSASLHHGAWGVIGTNAEIEAERRAFERDHPGRMLMTRGGGMPGVAFSARDARVLSISYQR